MKKLIYFIAISMSLSLISCEDDVNPLGIFSSCSRSEIGSSGQPEDVNEDSVQNLDSAVVDSLVRNMKDVKAEIAKTKSDVEKNQIEINGINENVRNNDSKIESIEQNQLTLKSLFVILVIYTIIILILVAWIVKKVGLRHKEVKGIVREYINTHDIPMQEENRSTGQSQASKNAIANIESRLRKLEEDRKYMPQTPSVQFGGESQKRSEYSGESYSVKESKEDKTDQQTLKKEFYMERPLAEGEFEMSLRKDSPTEDTYYKFILEKHNNNKATFVFDPINKQAAMRARNTHDKSIDPVCDGQFTGTNGDFSCTPGEAEFRDGKWKVTKKAFVIFK